MKSTKLIPLAVLFLVSCATPAPTPTSTLVIPATLTPVPTKTQTPIPTATITLLPTQIGGGSGRLIFTFVKDNFAKTFPDLKGETNVFVANIDGTDLRPVTNGLEGYNYLKDVSPDGTKALIVSTSQRENKKANLYFIDLSSNSEPLKIADSLPNSFGTNASAKWLDNENIVYVGQGNSGFGIYKVNVDGTSSTVIYQFNNDGEEFRPFEILAIDSKNERIYWDVRSKVPGLAGMYDVFNIWWSNIDGNSERTPLEFNGKQLQFTYGGLVFSSDGSKVAWTEETTPPSLHVASVSDINNPFTLGTISSQLIINWFPDGSKLLVFDGGSLPMSWEGCGKEPATETTSDLYGVYEVSVTPNVSIKNYHLPREKMMTCESWGGNANYMRSAIHDISPDGRQILWEILRSTEVGPDRILNFLNLETLSFSETSIPTLDGVHWIP